MLTGASPSHPTTDHLLFDRPLSPPFPHPPRSRSLTRALRFSTHNGIFQNPATPSDHWSAGALSTRTFSMGPIQSSTKGKEREAFDSLDSGPFGSFAFDDTFPPLANRKSSLGSSLSRPSTADPTSTPSVPRRQRGSILGAASDALRFGRRRKSVKALPPPPQPRLLISEVIEVRASAPTAPYDEDEEAEREQLRAAAVQSVGFNVGIGGSPDREHVTFGDEGDINDEGDHNAHVNVNQHENGRASTTAPPTSPPPPDNGLSDGTGSPQTVRQRAHPSSSSAGKTAPFASAFASTAAEVPAFPSTRAQITPHEQLSSTLPKHYPPPSLFMLALSKQWKARHVVLSAPVPTGVSYLHVFKSSAADERELERLEINEHSVASVTDEDVGGRRGVVRVGGFDVGALRRELNGEELGMTMVTLQIVDANESQNWINAIKNAILGQRSVRAGLGILTNSSGAPEPRGDLDVMLSMRMQGMLPSPTKPSFNVPDDANKSRQNGSSSEESSPPSVRSRPASPRSPNGVLSLKSLFSVSGSGSTRPRSPSLARATSPEAASGDSFGSAASSLLSMRTVADSPLIKPYSMLPPTGPTLDPTNQLQRKIIDTQSNLDWAPLEGPFKSSDVTLPISPPPRALSPSLNPPPPRRRAYTTNEPRLMPSPDTGRFVYNHCNASTAGSFGVQIPEPTNPHLERASSERGKPRAGSVSSTSTTTENGSARRWSRQSFMPPRLTPPSGSPQPASAPLPHPPPWQNSYHQVPEQERSPSRCSSQSQKTLPSIISGLHVASKRASTSSSVYSVATTNSSPQHVGTFSISRAAGASHRVSIPPPPRPVPSTALPPTPTGSDTECPATVPIGAGKSVRRNSLARRALRLSLGQAPASLQAQPHTNDGFGTGSRSHNRSTSVDGVPQSVWSLGYSIPQALLVPPSPPPTGPLPPPPVAPPSRTSTPVPATAHPRATSLKQRLRILSAPSGRSTPPPPITTVMPPVLPALEIPTMPVTPIGERIAHIAPDADFLHLDGETPVATVPPRSMVVPETAGTADAVTPPPAFSFPLPPLTLMLPQGQYEHVPPSASDRSPQQMTVLSPPPRRGSARPLPSPSPEQERGPSTAWNGDGALPPMPALDLACNASTLSLSIVNGAV